MVILACVAAASAQFKAGAYNRNPYNPFANQYDRNNQYYKPTTPSYRTYAPIVYPSSTAAPPRLAVAPVVAVARHQGDAHNAQTLKYGNEVNPDGSYAFLWVHFSNF